MKKNIFYTLICTAVIAVSCAGCQNKETTTTTTQKTISKGDGHINNELDLQKCCDDVEALFKGSDYELDDVSIEPPSSANDFFNIIIVTKNKPEDNTVYINLITECIELLNQQAIKQDPEYDASSEGYYGGLFDQYTMQLTATCVEDVLMIWPINQRIMAGTHEPIVTNNDVIDLNNLEY